MALSHASNFSAGQIPFARHLVWGCFNAGRDSVSKSSTSARANAEGERRASVLLKNSSSVLWQKRAGFLWQGDVRGWDVIADQAQGEIEVFQFQVYSVVGLSRLHFFIDQRSISKLKIWDKKKRAVTTTFWKLLDFSPLMNSFLPINTSKHKTNMLGLQFGRFGVGAISLWLHFKDLKDLKK